MITHPMSPSDCLKHQEIEVKRSVSQMPYAPKEGTGVKKWFPNQYTFEDNT
jgi:hypothetical protein